MSHGQNAFSQRFTHGWVQCFLNKVHQSPHAMETTWWWKFENAQFPKFSISHLEDFLNMLSMKWITQNCKSRKRQIHGHQAIPKRSNTKLKHTQKKITKSDQKLELSLFLFSNYEWNWGLTKKLIINKNPSEISFIVWIQIWKASKIVSEANSMPNCKKS